MHQPAATCRCTFERLGVPERHSCASAPVEARQRTWPSVPERIGRPAERMTREPWAVSPIDGTGEPAPAGRAALPARPEPGAAGGGDGAGRAVAGPRRRRHRQDPRADDAARPCPADRPGAAARGAGGDLHQPRRARDGRARRGADRPQRGRHVAGHLPRHGRAHAACPCRAGRPAVQLHHPGQRRSGAAGQADHPGGRSRRAPLAAAPAGRHDPALEGSRLPAGPGARPPRSAISRSGAASRSMPPTRNVSRR